MNQIKVKKAIIPAAGLGTRFLPATKAMPKEMLPILDKPTIQFIVEEAISAGIEEILIIVSQSKNSIIDHFDYSFELEERLKFKGKWSDYEMIRKIGDMANIHYIRQKEPMGLGHAILSAKFFVNNEPFAVLLGDDVIIQKNKADKSALEQCLDLFYQKHSSVVGVQEVPQKDVVKYGIVEPDGPFDNTTNSVKLKNMIEKPSLDKSPSNLAILGRYILSPSIFKELEKSTINNQGEIEITSALLKIAQTEGVYAKKFIGRRYDIGSKIGFLQATIDVSLSSPEIRNDLLKYLEDVIKREKRA